MSTTGRRRPIGAITRVKEIWQELDYAQRRSLELRTGISFDKPVSAGTSRAEIEELDALYDMPSHEEVPARTELPPANVR
jgi:hypothetical protein